MRVFFIGELQMWQSAEDCKPFASASRVRISPLLPCSGNPSGKGVDFKSTIPEFESRSLLHTPIAQLV